MQPASKAAWKIGGLKRGSTAFRIASTRSARASAAIAAASDASTAAARSALVAVRSTAARERGLVDVGEHHPLEEVAALRDRGDRGTDPTRSDHENPHERERYVR